MELPSIVTVKGSECQKSDRKGSIFPYVSRYQLSTGILFESKSCDSWRRKNPDPAKNITLLILASWRYPHITVGIFGVNWCLRNILLNSNNENVEIVSINIVPN